MTGDPCRDDVRGIGLDRQKEIAIKHVDIVPDWVIAVLAVLVVAGVFRLFGGFGVLVLGIVATAVWIAQIMASISSVRRSIIAFQQRLRIAAIRARLKATSGTRGPP